MRGSIREGLLVVLGVLYLAAISGVLLDRYGMGSWPFWFLVPAVPAVLLIAERHYDKVGMMFDDGDVMFDDGDDPER